jgi:nucleoside-diphosphate-sugar epimerase
MKRILVTGASGFIGKSLVNCLISKGFYVRTIGRTKSEGIEAIVCDFLKDVIPKNAFDNIDTVIHLAGYAHDLKNTSKNTHIYNKLNVDVTDELLSLSINNDVKRFIFVSSVKAGGPTSNGKCFSEEDQTYPNEIYGRTKRDAELKVLEAGNSSNMHVSILRPSLVYGPEVKGNLRLMISGIANNWFPPPPHIKNVRSMIHIDDVIDAIQLLASKKSANMGIFIATDGEKYSTREIYEEICCSLGKTSVSWGFPMLLFRIIGFSSPSLKYKIEKLLGDECYCSDKLKLLGFEAKKRLVNINETNF